MIQPQQPWGEQLRAKPQPEDSKAGVGNFWGSLNTSLGLGQAGAGNAQAGLLGGSLTQTLKKGINPELKPKFNRAHLQGQISLSLLFLFPFCLHIHSYFSKYSLSADCLPHQELGTMGESYSSNTHTFQTVIWARKQNHLYLIKRPKEWKQPKYPSTDEHINKIRYISTMEYYSTIKKHEVPIHTTAWMNLENIMLHKRSQSQRLYCIIPFNWNIWNRQIYGDRNSISVLLGSGGW